MNYDLFLLHNNFNYNYIELLLDSDIVLSALDVLFNSIHKQPDEVEIFIVLIYR